ncbi:hypothetical protein AHF37_02020 [Paragonimus kellicotti]|nr:hypothetical protein AHF37_02020 [Paragonimus kellicotti]
MVIGIDQRQSANALDRFCEPYHWQFRRVLKNLSAGRHVILLTFPA